MPAPDGQGAQGDRTGLRGVGRWGELWAPKEEEAERGHLLGSTPSPTPCASKLLPPWPVGWDPPGPEGQLRRALSPEMGGPQSPTSTTSGGSYSWSGWYPSVPQTLGHPKSCWSGRNHRNAPRNVPSPFPPTAAGSMPLACCPSPAPVPVGTYPPGCWQSCPLSLLPPCSQCPMPTVGLGWGRVTPVLWCQPGGPRPLGPTDKAQDPVLKPSPPEAAHGPRPVQRQPRGLRSAS